MKVFVVAVCLLAIGIVSAKEIHQYEVSLDEFIESNIRFMERQKKITANINDYMDNILLRASKFFVMKGYDPLQVDDKIEGFSVKIGLINFHGDFTLKHGWLQGLSGIYRSGDATMQYEGNVLNLRFPVAFNTMNINYDYKASIMNIGPHGGVEGKIHGMNVFVDITVDTINAEINLQDFQITDAGSVRIHFSGNPLVDWLVNVLTRLATKLLHNVVINVVEKRVRGLVQTTLNEFNDKIHNNTFADTDKLFQVNLIKHPNIIV